MIKEMVERFNNDAKRPLWLAVEDTNAPAIHLYNKYGFVFKEKGYNLTYLIYI